MMVITVFIHSQGWSVQVIVCIFVILLHSYW